MYACDWDLSASEKFLVTFVAGIFCQPMERTIDQSGNTPGFPGGCGLSIQIRLHLNHPGQTDRVGCLDSG